MSVSVVVPYRPGDEWRDRAWAWVEKRWRCLLPDAEIVTAGPDQPYADPGGFNHAQAINHGVARSSGDVLVIAEGDTTHSAQHLQHRLDQAAAGQWSRCDWYTCLTQRATVSALAMPPAAPLESIQVESEARFQGSWAGTVIAPREAFDRVGGYDERFDGWSPDDVAFGVSLDVLWGKNVCLGEVFHMWHPQPLSHRWGRHGFEAARDLSYRYMDAARENSPAMMRTLIGERG